LSHGDQIIALNAIVAEGWKGISWERLIARIIASESWHPWEPSMLLPATEEDAPTENSPISRSISRINRAVAKKSSRLGIGK
jgi:hypothetical protein